MEYQIRHPLDFPEIQFGPVRTSGRTLLFAINAINHGGQWYFIDEGPNQGIRAPRWMTQYPEAEYRSELAAIRSRFQGDNEPEGAQIGEQAEAVV